MFAACNNLPRICHLQRPADASISSRRFLQLRASAAGPAGVRSKLSTRYSNLQQQHLKKVSFPSSSHRTTRHHPINSRRSKSTAAAEEALAAVDAPTNRQLWLVFWHAAVPMIGFGFTDQTVMLQAGNAVDCTLGVTFGLSTLAAAAIGQVASDASGVVFGNSLERMAHKAGLPPTNLTIAQRALPIVARTTFVGSLLGIIAGCTLGLVNLLFIDTSRSSTLKLQAFSEEQEFEFTIEASNAVRDDATALTIQGPDIDGLLASMTAALAVRGCSLVEIHAQRVPGGAEDQSDKMIKDVFYVVKRETGEQFDDEELEELAEALLDSTRSPMNINVVKAQVYELESTNSYLEARIKKLEQVMYERQITLITSTGESRHPSAE